ncbi:hypothetical protein LMG9449_1500 [Lactococcus lactis subsp. lactis]|uniref:Uncharacterized protein n=1 Tax=Lactococcus lactis subsp. lactis TaxID=1360 RepID=A0A0V8AXZ9_LACLL|nr:hypothetical protein LK231_0967 [Lactococcus lactis subsp. lactis]CDI47355.1 hypothetical protein BN927_02423 [Lactococcus lactis subsp. lactis Dephy 1]KST81588.1 hypothetical protein ATCC19435_1730 [Lactococcus lactis subsp. lactis]KST96514.1 hypothetical protein LKF24_0740 [Lactococcus lactis subsp. lactis]KSU05591.1 hypothetical protein Li1_1347 [Lactococcus lactis subsp. lactis]
MRVNHFFDIKIPLYFSKKITDCQHFFIVLRYIFIVYLDI